MPPQTPRRLAGDGSDRRFCRLGDSPSVVLLHHPHPPGGAVTENDSYYHLGRHLKVRGTPTPEIYAYCREEGWLLLEDLGDLSLEAAVQGCGRDEARLRGWYHQALEVLARMQVQGREGFDPAWCFDTPVVDRPFLRERECGYFVRAFLRGYLDLEITADELAADFDRLLARALPPGELYFLHRDYQSRNLMLKEGRLRVIDWQGGRLGPLGYDVAALLIDPYVDLGPAREEELLAYYLETLAQQLEHAKHVDSAAHPAFSTAPPLSFSEHVGRESEAHPAFGTIPPLSFSAFREQYHYLALCRNLQILGAFGFLTKVKGKTYFANYIPAALASLRRRLELRAGEFPVLEEVIDNINDFIILS